MTPAAEVFALEMCKKQAEVDAMREVINAVTVMRDQWREDCSYIPPLEKSRDFGPALTRIWNALSNYERLSALTPSSASGGKL